MSTSIAELLPAIATLSHPEKFRLAQLILVQLAQEAGVEVLGTLKNTQPIAKKKSLRGCLNRYAKPELIAQEQDAWQTIAREKHEHRCCQYHSAIHFRWPCRIISKDSRNS